jgi:hypothetical protein
MPADVDACSRRILDGTQRKRIAHNAYVPPHAPPEVAVRNPPHQRNNDVVRSVISSVLRVHARKLAHCPLVQHGSFSDDRKRAQLHTAPAGRGHPESLAKTVNDPVLGSIINHMRLL